MVKNVKSTSRGSPIVFAKIIVNPLLDQCVPMTETAMTICVKCKSMAAKINSIYPPNILASVVSCLEKGCVYRLVHPMYELYATHFHWCKSQLNLSCYRVSHGKLVFFNQLWQKCKFDYFWKWMDNFSPIEG